ncbi:MAG: ISNCY family transposase [Longimicrobiales bacterium]
MLTLSQREIDRIRLLHQVRDGALTVTDAARRARLGVRHFRRLLRRFEHEGERAVVHRGRGRRPNNARPQVLRERVLERAREEVFHDFGPTLLSEHLARDPTIGLVDPHTLRRWLIEAGQWRVQTRGRRHRKRRPRREAFGELVLMDTSVHAWLEQRCTEEIVLIAMIDDATSRLCCRFFPRDNGAANRRLILMYLERWGRMGALYTDRAGHFQPHYRASRRRAQDQPEVLSLIRRALDGLDVPLILALSPQAKGRVERLFGTLQDRLIKELRVRAISSMQDANQFLEDEFIPFWNARFTVEPANRV